MSFVAGGRGVKPRRLWTSPSLSGSLKVVVPGRFRGPGAGRLSHSFLRGSVNRLHEEGLLLEDAEDTGRPAPGLVGVLSCLGTVGQVEDGVGSS